MGKKTSFEATEFNNVKEIIYNVADKYAEQDAFVIKEQEGKDVKYKNITYKAFLEDINKLGTAFFNMGLKKQRVAVIGKNRYEWILTHFTNLLGGGVSVPLDKDLQYEELENSLARSKATAIVFDPKLKESIMKIKENKKTRLKQFICMDKDENFICINELIEVGEKSIKEGNKEYINAEIDENEMNILLFTSGTTSNSKAVMLSQKNVASNIYAMQCVEDIRSTDTNIVFLPLHHIFGSTCILVMIASGVKNVFPDGLRYIQKNLNEYKVTLFVGVPILIEAIYKTLMKEVEKQGKTKMINTAMKISNFLLKFKIDIRRKIFKQIIDALGGELRLLISGGAPADSKISEGFNSLGINIVQGYGLTETAPVIAAESYFAVRNGSVGKPMINDTIEIFEPDEDGIGQIRVKGPNVMLGYYDMPEQTESVLKDGWFYTGDLGYFDKDGFLFVTGRSKSMIVLKNGKKVFPEELETLVNRLKYVTESMVFGLPDKDDENDVKLSVKVVYNKEETKDKTEEEIREIIWDSRKELNKTFPRYKHIQNMILTDKELIKTTTKKVKRQEELKTIFGEDSTFGDTHQK